MPIDGSSSSSSFGSRHQRAADREHLLLAAGHRARLLRLALLAGAGTARRRARGRRRCSRVAAQVGAELEVLAHGHAREAAAGPRATARCPSRTISCGGVLRDLLARRSGSSPSRGGVRPEIERSVVDLPAPLEPISVTLSPSSTVERDALERLDVAVVGVDVLDLEERHRRSARLAACRGRPRRRAGWRAPRRARPRRSSRRGRAR